MVGVPSAALFAALVVGIALALTSLAPERVPRPAGIAAQGVLGVYIGTMVHHDAVSALGPDWPIVIAIAVATLLLSVVAGALLGLHRDVSPLTGSLALVAGGASGLGRDRPRARRRRSRRRRRAIPAGGAGDRVDAGGRHPGLSRRQVAPRRDRQLQTDSAPWYLSVAMMVALVARRRDRRPAGSGFPVPGCSGRWR